MGWGRMLLLGNWGQQLDIQDQKKEIDDLRRQFDARGGSQATTAQARIAQLEKDNAKLRLYLAALIKYLGHKGMLDQEEFRVMVDAIDSEDGVEDGGYRGEIMS